MIFSLSIVFLFLGLSSCSTQKRAHKKTHSDHHQFSQETEMSFEMIERKKALEYYRFLRVRKSKQIESNYNKKRKVNRPRSTPRIRAKIRPRVIPKKPTYRMVNEEQQEQEILQRMSYFCMENRKQARFDQAQSGEDCNQHTQRIRENCNTQFPIGTDRLTRCIKRNLR